MRGQRAPLAFFAALMGLVVGLIFYPPNKGPRPETIECVVAE